ncbi:MAG: hypothetical protein ACRDFS_07030 [Chloroflexota bacterium]
MEANRRSEAERVQARDEMIRQRFPDPVAQERLREVASWISKVIAGAPPSTGSKRRAAFVTANKAAERLSRALSQLDLYTLVTAMGSLEGPPIAGSDPPGSWSLLPQRLDELSAFRNRLTCVSRALANIAAQEPPVRRGAPPIDDPLTFGVEWVGAIWERFPPGAPLTGSKNRGGFEEFVVAFFIAPPLNFPESGCRTAVRYYIEGRQAKAATQEKNRSSSGSTES